MDALKVAALEATPLIHQPFEYLIVPNFIQPEALAAIHADYPRIEAPGSFPLEGLTYGPAFLSLIDELQGPEVEAAFADKFRLNLKGRPTLLTVRGHCGPRDGRIHTDTASKLLTVLLYLNPRWEEPAGCLRLLRSARDMEDVLVEVPPIEGTLVAFRRSHNSFHGHKPFVGPRRVLQLNWLTTHRAQRRGLFRHRLSAWAKRTLACVRPQVPAGVGVQTAEPVAY